MPKRAVAVGNVPKLFALPAALIAIFAVGCGPAFHRPQARVPRSEMTVLRPYLPEPQHVSLPEEAEYQCEVIASDDVPTVEPAMATQVSCTCGEPCSCAAPVVEPPASNDTAPLPFDPNGDVVNPFRNGRMEGFDKPDAHSIPFNAEPAESAVSEALRATSASTPAKAQSVTNDAAEEEVTEPAPLDLPPEDPAPPNRIETPPSTTETPRESSAKSIPSTDDGKPPMLIAAQNFAFSPPVELVATTAAPTPFVSPTATANVVSDAATSNTRAAKQPIEFPRTPAEALDALLASAPATELIVALPNAPPVAAAPTTTFDALPQEPIVASDASSEDPKMAPPPPTTEQPTLQVAVMPESRGVTIPLTSVTTSPNLPPQALLVIRVETAPAASNKTPMVQHFALSAQPESTSPSSPLRVAPVPLEEPAVSCPEPVAAAAAPAPVNSWRRPKIKSAARRNEGSPVTNRVAEHLSHNIFN
jgi:hypothetical protein